MWPKHRPIKKWTESRERDRYRYKETEIFVRYGIEENIISRKNSNMMIIPDNEILIFNIFN